MQLSLVKGSDECLRVYDVWDNLRRGSPRSRTESLEATVTHLASQGPCTSQSLEFMLIHWGNNRNSSVAGGYIYGSSVNTHLKISPATKF